MAARAGGLVVLSMAAFALASSITVSAQQSPARASSASSPLVIRVGLDLIQMDASVTDKSGRPVTDLRAEDFTLEVDGRKQPVTNAAHFGPSLEAAGEGGSESPPAARAYAATTVVFLVDDLNMAFGSMFAARQALAKFATTRTPAGAAIGMRLTSDESKSMDMLRSPEEILLAAGTLRYFIRSGQQLSAEEGVPGNSAALLSGARAVEWTTAPEAAALVSGADPTFVRQNLQQRVSSLVATIDAMRSLPGRKALVFLSEGFLSEAFFSTSLRDEVRFPSPYHVLFDDSDLRATLRMITEVANRASVVVYTIDPRGLTLDFAGAESYVTPEEAAALRRSRSQARIESQGSLRQLAADTGGIAVVNSGIPQGLDKVVGDHSAYYLIGFEPAQTTFARASGRPKFHKIKLSVNRKGVRVRTRAGFYGVTDEEVAKRAPALTSPAH